MLQCLADKHRVPPELEDEKEKGGEGEGERVGIGGGFDGGSQPHHPGTAFLLFLRLPAENLCQRS